MAFVLTSLIVTVISLNSAYGQSCESFDGFSNCGNNYFDCVSDAACMNAFTSPGWVNVTGDDIDWSVSDTATLSESTGPDFDHTSGNGKFLFTEASACYNQTAKLLTPVYNLTGITNPELQFWYHMHGQDMGSLTVEIENPSGSGTWSNLWSLSGPQGNAWYLSIINLTSYSGNSVRFRFTGVTGPAFESDIALDDICVVSGCVQSCDDSNPCTNDFCYNGNCFNQVKICDDGNACTADTCENGICINTPLDCDDGNICTFDYCFVGECFSDSPCDDYEACTVDSCDGQGNCINTPLICDDNNPCSFDYCDFGFCYNESLCDDFDPCTTDSCDGLGGCFNIEIFCDDASSCTNDECVNGVCAYVSNCHDNNPCTMEECVNNSCKNSLPQACLCAQPGDSIGEMSAFISDSIVVSGQPGLITDLDVSVEISHPYIGDLQIVLISPKGTIISLFDGQCGSVADIKTVFDDEGYPLMCPPSGFLPTQSYDLLSAFDGEAMNGTWKIEVTDLFPFSDDGILIEWCLLPTTAGCAINAECSDSDPCTDDVCQRGNCQHFSSTACNLTISGKISTDNGTPVHTVRVALTGTETDNDTTANDGLYSLNISKNGDYTITPTKNNDISSNNGISTIDILYIRKHILNSLPLSTPFKVMAADVNGSESVSTADIVLTRKVILQAVDSFPTGKLWAFVPANHIIIDSLLPFPYPESISYSNVDSSLTNQDFIAVKFGDVNNSWDPGTPKTEPLGKVQFTIGEHEATSGEEIIVPVKVKDFRNITGYQFTLSWNEDVIEFVDVINKSLNGYYGTSKAGDGYLTTTWDDELVKGVTLGENANVFEVRFKAKGSSGAISEIRIGSELTVSEAYNENLDLLEINAPVGFVKVIAGNHSVSGFRLSVHPNPFSNSAYILFSIPDDKNVRLIIYDVIGKEMKQLTGFYKKGQHQIQWSGDDGRGNELRKGLYYIRMTAGDASLTSKVIIIR